ncbi:alpha-amylase family glycosyl hydrolase [Halobacillus andaensis]|uniref:alpha-amylase family glycosyl hydrolase n=1 Tax=Halobacillus andaensis TaxID=1176239 RepID=UPI003D74A22E
MKKPNWLKNAVFYEIYPQSFNDTNNDGIGDIQGIIEKLDYIKELGCNAIWINPCWESPFKDAGYDVSDYKKVADRYGSNKDLIECFEEAHKRGIKVVLDLVPGHTSDQHPWFLESKKAERNEFSDRYIWTNDFREMPLKYNYVSGLSPRDGNYLVNFFSSQPALNYGFSKVTADWQMHYTDEACVKTFEAIIDVMRFWLDNGCDGFRVDMAMSLVKDGEGSVDMDASGELWKKARKMLDIEYPEAVMISEWGYPEHSVMKGNFHADFYLEYRQGHKSLLRNWNTQTGEDNSYFSKQGNGDINQFLADYLPMYELIKEKGYANMITCNHDTARLSKSLDENETKLAYAFIFTMPGMPFLYYGDEIGIQYFSLTDKEGGYFRTGSRTPMQWDDSKNLGFSKADTKDLYLPVDSRTIAPTVKEQENKEDSLLNTVKQLIELRHNYEDLQADAEFEAVWTKNNGYPFIYRRGQIYLAINPSQNIVSADFKIEKDLIFSIGKVEALDEKISLQPQSFGVFA